MKTCLHTSRPRRPRRSADGSAVFELVIVAPFLLVLAAAIWDIRAYTAFRTDLAREMYDIAEMLAATGDSSWTTAQKNAAAQNIVDAATTRLDNSSVGWLRAVVVTRRMATSTPATVRNAEGRDCDAAVELVDDTSTAWDDTEAPWCEPQVRRQIGRVAWGDEGGCATIPSDLPAAGAVFAPNQKVLPNEGADPDGDGPLPVPTHDQWVSRSFSANEWWVAVETCSHYGRDANPNDAVRSPGLIMPGLANLGIEFFDVRFTIHRLAAWGAIDPIYACHWEWCGSP